MKQYDKAFECHHSALKIRIKISTERDPKTIACYENMQLDFKYLKRRDAYPELEKVLNDYKFIYFNVN